MEETDRRTDAVTLRLLLDAASVIMASRKSQYTRLKAIHFANDTGAYEGAENCFFWPWRER